MKTGSPFQSSEIRLRRCNSPPRGGRSWAARGALHAFAIKCQKTRAQPTHADETKRVLCYVSLPEKHGLIKINKPPIARPRERRGRKAASYYWYFILPRGEATRPSRTAVGWRQAAVFSPPRWVVRISGGSIGRPMSWALCFLFCLLPVQRLTRCGCCWAGRLVGPFAPLMWYWRDPPRCPGRSSDSSFNGLGSACGAVSWNHRSVLPVLVAARPK